MDDDLTIQTAGDARGSRGARRAEARAPWRSEEQYRRIVETAQEGILALDPAGAITYLNQRMAIMLGYTIEELRGEPIFSFIHEDQRAAARAAYAQRRWRLAETRQFDACLRHKGGGEVWVLACTVALTDEAGAFAGEFAMLTDITERKRVEERLRRSEEQYRRIVETAQEGIWQVDPDGATVFVNPKMSSLLGYSVKEMLGQSLFSFLDAESRRLAIAGRERRLRGHTDVDQVEVTYVRKDGTTLQALVTSNPLFDEQGSYTGSVSLIMDITARKQVEEELRHLALHDTLTGLPNRALLNDRVEHGILLARRAARPQALLLLDLDRFKEINDTFGHHHGDAVLRQIAQRLCAAVRASDTVARLGGDEFAVLLGDCDAAAAVVSAGTLRAALEAPVTVEGQPMHLGASIGVALYPDHGADALTLLRRADVAMYVAKRQGLGVHVYAPEHDRFSRDRIALTTALRQAIEGDELELHYQPIMEVGTGTVSRVEALARWPRADAEQVPPDVFIPLAEETGLIGALTRGVLRMALRQCRAWRRAGHPLKVGVNLSMANLAEPELAETVLALLQEYEVPAESLRVELTESAVMSEQARSLEVLTSLAAAGIAISVDDFGTGYSSLAYLTRLPVDELKIDKSFVQRMGENRADEVIVRSTVALAHALGLRVVAEGVENAAAWACLEQYGCDAAQGYYLSRPLPAAELEGWLRRPRRHEIG